MTNFQHRLDGPVGNSRARLPSFGLYFPTHRALVGDLDEHQTLILASVICAHFFDTRRDCAICFVENRNGCDDAGSENGVEASGTGRAALCQPYVRLIVSLGLKSA
jgi:hypothetical protein